MTVCLGFITDAISPGELFVLFVLALLFFGGKRLPEVARTAGRTLERLRRAADQFRDQLTAEIESPESADTAARKEEEPPPLTAAPPDNPDQTGEPAALENHHDLAG
jgi:Sec-independent protein translocase protein TatA